MILYNHIIKYIDDIDSNEQLQSKWRLQVASAVCFRVFQLMALFYLSKTLPLNLPVLSKTS